MIIIDSSILIAAFRSEEKHCEIAGQIIMNSKSIFVTDHILSETLTVLKIKENYDVAVKCYDFLINNKKIIFYTLTNDEFQNSLTHFIKNKNKLSLVDTTLVVLSEVMQIPVATFDKDLQKVLKNEK